MFQNWNFQRWSVLNSAVSVRLSVEQCCFTDFINFNAISLSVKNTSADQGCFRAVQRWVFMNQRCSEVKFSTVIRSKQRFSLLMYPESELVCAECHRAEPGWDEWFSDIFHNFYHPLFLYWPSCYDRITIPKSVYSISLLYTAKHYVTKENKFHLYYDYITDLILSKRDLYL